MHLPFISVILPVRNEERFITACVQSIFSQDYPADQMEVLFVDGRSEDRTVELLCEMQKVHPQIVVLDNPNRTVPYAMNIGIARSRGEIIVRLDAHAEYPPDYVRLSVETLLTRECDNAGGVFETRGRGFMGEAIAEMLKTPLGVGNATYRLTQEDGYVDTVPFGCFRRELFDRIGGFDERMTRNQDNELNFRIRKNGGKIYLNHNIRVLYYCRDTLRGIMKMGYMNGRWNVITMTLVPGSMGVRHFVPLAFVLSTLVLLALTLLTRSLFFGGLLALEWGAYLLLDFFYAYTIAKEKGWRFLPVEIVLYPAFHFAYGFGSLSGIAALPGFLRQERRKKRGREKA
ncbi:MAG TPA: glycosyltransferase family 2 protein [Candidatus Ventricola intestinavium]|nr:glycosyltransferase family 2 protein [Candidatus Ventricola intestinavium]